MSEKHFKKDAQFYKFCLYGFLKNLRFFDAFLLLFLLYKLDNNYSSALSLYSVRFIVRAALEIPSGVIADALGRKGSMLLSYGVYIASFIAYFWATNFAILLIPTILFGVADAFRTGTHKAMILEYLNQKGWQKAKVDYYGRTRSWSQAGSAISSLVAAMLMITTQNYSIIFLATVVPYILGFMLLASYPKSLDRKVVHNAGIFQQIKISASTSFETLKKRKNLILLANTSFYFGFHNAVKDLLQPIITAMVTLIPIAFLISSEQKSSLLIGIVYFIIYFLSSFASKNAGRFSKKFPYEPSLVNRLAIVGIGLAIAIATMLILGFPAIAASLFLAFFPIISLQRPPTVSWISKNFDRDIMATTLSIESQMASLIAAILSFIAGKLIHAFNLGIGLGVLSLSCFMIILLFQFNYGKKNNTRINQQLEPTGPGH